MNKIDASTGWAWVQRGFALFRQQPGPLFMLFSAYMFLMLGIGLIPVLGQLLPLILTPVFSIGFMRACTLIEGDERISPGVLLSGFRSPDLTRLLTLGLLYPLAAGLAVGVSCLFDDGTFWQVISGQIELDPKSEQASTISLHILLAGALYAPACVVFWYAASLIAWQKMSIGKAIFFSVLSIARAVRAFLVYSLCWLGIIILLSISISVIIGILANNSTLGILVLFPSLIALTMIMNCSFYASYADLFGRPQSPADAPAGNAE
jgi:hypothetical protein